MEEIPPPPPVFAPTKPKVPATAEEILAKRRANIKKANEARKARQDGWGALDPGPNLKEIAKRKPKRKKHVPTGTIRTILLNPDRPTPIPDLQATGMTPEQRAEYAATLIAELGKSFRNRRLERFLADTANGTGAYPWQMAFYEAGSKSRERAILAANRVGKTFCVAAEIALHATGNYPEWWKGRRFDRPVNVWVCGTSNQDVRDIQQTELMGKVEEGRRPSGTGWVPHAAIGAVTFRQCGVSCVIDTVQVKHVSGGMSTIGFKSFEQGAIAFQGVAKDVCIAEGELVQMFDGTMKPIENIKVGDVVLSLNAIGEPVGRKVLVWKNNGVRECVSMETRSGTIAAMTPDHEVFWGYRYDSKERVDRVKNVAQIIPGVFWPEECADRDDAWYVWSALAVAEGSYRQKKITNGDVSMMERAISMLPPGARCRRKDFSGDHVQDWFLHWKDFWDGMEIALSHEKSIPDWVFKSSKSKVRMFLRWLYAGDGWANGHSVGYATTSIVLAKQIHVLLNRLGVRSSMNKRRSANQQWRDQFWIVISKSNEVKRFIDEIGIESKLKACSKVLAEAERRIVSKQGRGNKAWQERASSDSVSKAKSDRVRMKSTTIRRVEDCGKKTVYDITVEGTSRFLVGTSLVSNCWMDEEPENDPNNEIFAECLMRLMTTQGIFMFTRTPLFGRTAIVSHFLSGKGWYINVGWDQAKHMTEAQRAEFLLSVPEHQRETRSKGVPMMGSGGVYPVADSLIECDPFEIPTYWRRICGIDFGIDHPAAAAWIAHDPDADVVYLYDCYKQSGQTAAYHAEAIRARGKWIPVAWPHDGIARDKGGGVQLHQMYRAAGVNLLADSARFDDDKGGPQSRERGSMELLERMNTGRFKVFRHLAAFMEEKRMLHRKDGLIVAEHDDIESAVRYASMSLRFAISDDQTRIARPAFADNDYNPLESFASSR